MALLTQVPAPRRKPRVGGIKDVVGEFVKVDRLGGPSEGITWDADFCDMDFSETTAGCVTQALEMDPNSSFVGESTDTFAIYVGEGCWLGSDADETFADRAQRHLEAVEGRAIESRIAGMSGATVPRVGTLGGSIGMLEAHAAANYPGLPILMMDSFAAASAFEKGALAREGGKLVTGLGTPVVVTASDAGHVQNGGMMIMGQPEVYATDAIVHQVDQHSQNKSVAIAQRVYAIAIDCGYIAISPAA